MNDLRDLRGFLPVRVTTPAKRRHDLAFQDLDHVFDETVKLVRGTFLGGWFVLDPFGGFYERYRHRLHAASGIDDPVLELLARFQLRDPVRKGITMQEDIASAVVSGNEAEPFLGVVPLDSTGGHSL